MAASYGVSCIAVTCRTCLQEQSMWLSGMSVRLWVRQSLEFFKHQNLAIYVETHCTKLVTFSWSWVIDYFSISWWCSDIPRFPISVSDSEAVRLGYPTNLRFHGIWVTLVRLSINGLPQKRWMVFVKIPWRSGWCLGSVLGKSHLEMVSVRENPMKIPWKSHENPMKIPWTSHENPMLLCLQDIIRLQGTVMPSQGQLWGRPMIFCLHGDLGNSNGDSMEFHGDFMVILCEH